MHIFALVNRLIGLPRESAFSLNSAIGELGHFTQYKVRIGNEFSLGLYSYLYDIRQVEKFRQPYPLYTTGSPSPTNRDRVRWMAPLSSLWLKLSEPRIEVAPDTYQGYFMKKAILLLMSVICMALLASCGGGTNSKKAASNIRTADQWVNYCDSEPNIHRCLNSFDKIDIATQCRIFEDLTTMVAHLTYTDEKGPIKSDAFGYLWFYMLGNAIGYEKGDSMKAELERMGKYDNMNVRAALMVVTLDRLGEIAARWKSE